MIAPLRRRHRMTMAALLVALPALVALALAARREEPRMNSLPAGLETGPRSGGADVESYELFAELGVAVRGRRTVAGATLELAPAKPLGRPDVLVYWSAENADSERWTEGALLLGVLGDRARIYSVPATAAARDGYLVLYSLAHQEVLAAGALAAMIPPPDHGQEDAP